MKASSGSAACKQAAVKSEGTNNFMQTKRRIARDSLNYSKLQIIGRPPVWSNSSPAA
jgi:hypothetical protein